MHIKDSYNFLLFGDSISKGVVYDEERKKYTVLQENYGDILQTKLKGVICNAGKFGNTIKRGLSRLQSDVLKKNPDIVLVEFGGNDCDFNWEEIANNPEGQHYPKTDFNIFEKMLKNLIESLKNINITPVLMSLPPLDADRYFKWVSKNSSAIENRILSWLGSVNKIYWWQERYNSVIISVAEETKTRWIDVRGAFLKTPDYTQFICIDGIHPNVHGHKLIANKIIDYIESNYSFLLKEGTV